MKGDVILSMIICSLFLQDVPMGYREKVILCILIMKYMDIYIKTEADIQWVDKQIKKMESEMKSDGQQHAVGQRDVSEQGHVLGKVALCRTDSAQWNWPSNE
jgi:hypothetical protein